MSRVIPQLRHPTEEDDGLVVGWDHSLKSFVYTTKTGSGNEHNKHLIVPLAADGASITWTNMPAAVTFFAGSHRHVTKVDLSDFTECRLVVNKQGTAGLAGSKLILRYRTAFSTTASQYLDIGTSEVSVTANATNNVLSSSWVPLAELAKADVFLAIIGSGGDGVLDPVFGSIKAQFR